jgi:hypothetical protein
VPQYFVTGYGDIDSDQLIKSRGIPAPEDAAERGHAYDALLYSEAAQLGGMTVFTVEAPSVKEALVKGAEAYVRWRAGELPDVH